MSEQYVCSGCGLRITSPTAREHTARVRLHEAIHRTADTLAPLAGLEPGPALEVASQMARAMVAGAPRHLQERLDVAMSARG